MSSTNGISALLIDDHKLIVIGLETILRNSDINFREIECVTTGNAALERISKRDFDLYIVDIELPDVNGFDLIETIHKSNPQAHIIVNTIHEELSFFRKIEKYNVDAVVCKSLDTDALKDAIRYVMGNRKYSCEKNIMEHQNSKTALPAEPDICLSKTEIKVLQLIAKGLSTTAIAERLFVTHNTIETHRRHINEKLGTKNMAGMITRGLKLGLIKLD